MSCTSENSTSIITSNMEFLSCASSSTSSSSSFTPGGRAIDRYNPIITDDKRRSGPISASAPTTPCTNIHPIKPTRRKNRKVAKQTPAVDDHDVENTNKSVSKSSYLMMEATACTIASAGLPESSSRYLLGESSYIDVLSDFDPVLKLAQKKAEAVVEVEVAVDPKLDALLKDPKPDLQRKSSSGSSDQVVILKVSLHCRGCERKMKKHLSKMPGVRSFNIEFEAKKVTVVGDVTPLQVLSSISKVKNAQLWNPAMSSSYTLKL